MKRGLVLFFVITLSLFFAVSLYAGSSGKAPDVISLDTMKDKYEAVPFTHKKHADMISDCGKCHHQHGNNAADPCKDCHAVTPSVFKQSVTAGFLPCRNCHTSPNPQKPHLVSLKVAYHSKCFECHRGMGNIGTDPKGCTEMCHAIKGTKLSSSK